MAQHIKKIKHSAKCLELLIKRNDSRDLKDLVGDIAARCRFTCSIKGELELFEKTQYHITYILGDTIGIHCRPADKKSGYKYKIKINFPSKYDLKLYSEGKKSLIS